MVNFVKDVLRRHELYGKKSTALQPIVFIALILTLGVVGAIHSNVDIWIIWTFFALLGVVLILFSIGFIFFMIKDPDALRSETYNMAKFAMERGLIGDDNVGTLFEPSELNALPLTPDSESEE